MKTIAEGTQAPDFELPDQDGTPVRLSERLADGPVVLFFYPVAMTGGCTKEACHFRDLATEFKEAGAQRLGISTDPVAKQKEFADVQRLRLPAAVRRVRRRGPLVRREAEVHHPGEAGDLRHRPRPHHPQGDHQRDEHGRARGPGARAR